MKIDIEPGSIKDQALQVIARGPVNRTQLGNSVSCNGALLSIALDGMQRDGWIRKNEAGNYELLVEVDGVPDASEKAGEQGGSAPGLNGAVSAEPPPPRPADSATEMTTPPAADAGETQDSAKEEPKKLCPACDEVKPQSAFDKGMHRCRTCAAENRPTKRTHKKAPAASSTVAKNAPDSAPPDLPPRDVTVIPAHGALECRCTGVTFEIRQHMNVVIGSMDQLERLRDWCDRQLKVGGGAL